jgi:hypothetical protein
VRYLVKLECVVDLPPEQTIEDLADASLTEALCYGLRYQAAVFAKPSPDHNGDRGVSIVDGSMADIERKAKRLRKQVERPWNWCHKCRQPVDIDDESMDGSEHRCWGCDRYLMLVCFEGGSAQLFSPDQMRRMGARGKSVSP